MGKRTKTGLWLAVGIACGLWCSPPVIAGPPTVEELEERVRRLEEIIRRNGLDVPPAKSSGGPTAGTVEALDRKVQQLEHRADADEKSTKEALARLPHVSAGRNGFSVASPDDDFHLTFRGFLQTDGSVFFGDRQEQLTDNIVLRRMRIMLEGTLYKHVDFRLAPDFGRGRVQVFDAQMDLHYLPQAALTVGKFRPPVGLERVQGAPNLHLIERSFATLLVPNREIGVMLHGQFAKPGTQLVYAVPPVFRDFLSYEVGVFDGLRDSQNSDGDSDENKEFAGRVFTHPFIHGGWSPLEKLGIGFAGTWGDPQSSALRGLDSPGQQQMFGYKKDVVARGEAWRIMPEGYWYWGPFGLMAEYVRSTQHLAFATDDEDGVRQTNRAWQVAASYILTGEDNGFQGVSPRHAFIDPAVVPERPFNPFGGDWGALGVAARYHEIHFDEAVFGTFVDPDVSVSAARAFTVGLNWYLNGNLKLMANYEQTRFDGGAPNGGDRDTEKAFLWRFQFVY